MLKNIADTNQNLETEKGERKYDTECATTRKDGMQVKIDELFKYNKDKVELHDQRAKDNMHSD